MKLFLDSSSLVKAFSIEYGSHVTQELFQLTRTSNSKLTIGISESVSALDQKYFRRRLATERERTEAVGNLYYTIHELEEKGHLEHFPVIIDISDRDVIDKLILSRHISADDALHIHTAKKAGYIHILSADKALVDAAKHEGMNAYYHNNEADCRKLFVDITKQ